MKLPMTMKSANLKIVRDFCDARTVVGNAMASPLALMSRAVNCLNEYADIGSNSLTYINDQGVTIDVDNWHYSYDAWGRLHSTVCGFKGGREDTFAGPTITHFGARDYSPTLGRWMEPDPAGYVDGVNYYQFVGSSPQLFTDSSGLDFENRGNTGSQPLWWLLDPHQQPNVGGGHGNQPVGSVQVNTPPVIVTGTSAAGCHYAYVRPGTGIVKVIRSFTGIQSGDQGIGVAGSFYRGLRVFVTPQLAAALNGHEEGHIVATEKIYAHTIGPAEREAEFYRDEKRLYGNNGETEAELRDQLVKMINWDASIASFSDLDTRINGGNDPNSFHGWEAAQGGGPVAYQGAADIGGVHYGMVLQDRSQIDPNYHDPNYGSYDPYAP